MRKNRFFILALSVVFALSLTAAITSISHGNKANLASAQTEETETLTLSDSFVYLYLKADENGAKKNKKTLSATSSDSGKIITWSTSDNTVATVSGGLVTAHKKGLAIITASIDGAAKNCLVYVADTASSYAITKASQTDYANDTENALSGVWKNGNGNDWNATLNDGVLSVGVTQTLESSKRFMLRYKPFNAKFTAKYTVKTTKGGITVVDNGSFGTTTLSESQAKAGFTVTTSVSVTAGGYWQIALYDNVAGENVTISDIVITPTACNTGSHGLGANGRCKYCGKQKLSLDKSFVNLYLKADDNGVTKNTAIITATAWDSGDNVTWATTDHTVAKVENGVVTGLKKGWTTITATMNGAKRTCVVYVVDKPSSYATEFKKGSEIDKSLAGVWLQGHGGNTCMYSDGVLTADMSEILTGKTKYMYRYMPFNTKFTATYTVKTIAGGVTVTDTGSAGKIDITAEQAKVGYTITTAVDMDAIVENYWQISIQNNTVAQERVTISNIAIKPDSSEEARRINYYFDSFAVEDGDGSEEKPFNDLAMFADIEIEAGDKIALKRGSVFNGGLQLKNVKGNKNAEVVITAYGNESLPKPKINGSGKEGSGVVYIENCEYITVENLEVYDEATTEGDRRGVLINVTNPSGEQKVVTYRNVTIKNLYVHDIHGITDAANSGMSTASKLTGGIHVWTSDGYGRFDGLYIKDNKVENVENVGISTWYKPGTTGSCKVSPYSSDFTKFSYANVVIENNEVCYIGKNAIFARNLMGGSIKGNVVYETAIKCVSGNAICTSFVYGTVVEYNEGYFNRAKARADGKLQDGCMLDADLQSRDTVWQYNYSHDNAFGLFLNCTSYNDSGVEDVVTVRYNLSVHDYGNKGIIYINFPAKNVKVYNNTFVVSKQTSPIILKSNENRNFEFYNNIIYNLSPNAKFEIADTINASVRNNLVYSAGNGSISDLAAFKNLNKNGIYEDPKFASAYYDSTERAGFASAERFKLKSTSPAYGKACSSENVKDFFGNPYSNAIGFYCGK